MRKIFLLLTLVLSWQVRLFAGELEWQNVSRDQAGALAVALDYDDPQVIYLGLSGAVSLTNDAGASWRNTLIVKGQNRQVNYLFQDFKNRNFIWAATGNGLYYSSDRGRSWRRIFKGKSSLEAECNFLTAFSDSIYLGTSGGLFISPDNGRSWHKENGELGNCRITNIAVDSSRGFVYVVSSVGVFRDENKKCAWRKIYGNRQRDERDDSEDIVDEREEINKDTLKYLVVDNDHNCIYLATSDGILISQDKGESWQRFSDYGLLSHDVELLLCNKSKLYAATKSAIFEYNQERWQELSFGLAVSKVNTLGLDHQGNIFAACDKGLFKAKAQFCTSGIKDLGGVNFYSGEGLSIRELQKAAIRYAEVEPEKIKKWRLQAACKAWLPHVSAGVDRDTGDLWHWESGSTTKADDDTLRRGKDSINWSATLSWDLSNVIFNNDQTSIDARSRLMVQLRDDILDEVNKTYFERLRVKAELDNLAIEDRKRRLEKELRLEELAASLDALTGGYFSQRLKPKIPSR